LAVGITIAWWAKVEIILAMGRHAEIRRRSALAVVTAYSRRSDTCIGVQPLLDVDAGKHCEEVYGHDKRPC